MPECIECGAYTKFNNGHCKDCFQKQNGNPWVSGVIKGRIAETIVEQLFISLGFQVFKYGMENSIPGISDLLKGVRGDVSKNIRQMPDFVVFKDKQAHFIEVKFRKNGSLSIKDIESYGDYPFENALFVLLSPKHIKCISYKELKAGKVIHEKCRNWLGSRKEFETDKELIIDYCRYAIKFFENVD
ncbi:hypothetical protein [Kriegella aquimaris]|uniref:Uncharacterized protein n=1 Tax=Kriegella aquimaris TaxID=192904 RepID=A0A1G9LCT3_9FLAO|nr:hypothetical protein [Kriegella aquimaris]SDL59750.1 hypothetical protein SAMN04488514_10212 [Kriegella aquimaris]